MVYKSPNMGYKSLFLWVMAIVTLLITPLLTTPEPPSRAFGPRVEGSCWIP